MDFQLMNESWPQLAAAIPATLSLAVASLGLGFVIGVATALARLSPRRWLSRIARGYIHLFRSTPLLVQLFLIYYGSGQFRATLEPLGLWIFFREPWFCAILALTLNTGAYTAEIVRGGILAVGRGLVDAARALGLSGITLYREIIFPIAMRQALPAYGNEIILVVKATSLASTITIIEITGAAKKLNAETFSPIEVFALAGAFYLAINFLMSSMVKYFEFKMAGAARDLNI